MDKLKPKDKVKVKDGLACKGECLKGNSCRGDVLIVNSVDNGSEGAYPIICDLPNGHQCSFNEKELIKIGHSGKNIIYGDTVIHR